jgi:hypothetical protein
VIEAAGSEVTITNPEKVFFSVQHIVVTANRTVRRTP